MPTDSWGLHWFRRDLRVAGNPALRWSWRARRRAARDRVVESRLRAVRTRARRRDDVRAFVPERRDDDEKATDEPRAPLVDHAAQKEKALALYRRAAP